MMKFEVDTKEAEAYIQKIAMRSPKLASKAVMNTAQYANRKVKTTISKRSGNLRRTYAVKRLGLLSAIVESNSVYAEAVESGRKSVTIRPKRVKYLTIPLSPAALTGSGAQIRKSAYKDPNLVRFTKGPVTIPAFGGTHTIREKVMPSVNERFSRELYVAMEKAVRGV